VFRGVFLCGDCMNRRTFLETILCPDGLYCLKTIDGSGRGKQLFFDDIEELIDASDVFDGKPVNTFYAVASFKERKEKGVKGAREHSNIAAIRTFFLDLDCGEDKGFATQGEAFRSLKELCRTLGLPKPYVVLSGGGFHVYWPLEEAVTFDLWRPVALRLKKLCKEQEFHADHGCTADGSRILRMPLTKNIKYDPPKDVPIKCVGAVTSFEAFKKIVGEDEAPLTIATVAGAEFSGLNQQLAGNKEAIFKLIVTESLQDRGCNQIKYLVTHQNEAPEPLWRAGLSIAQFCSDRDKAIHFISKKHDEYNFAKTETKANEIPKPNTCEYFSDTNPEGCKGCPLKGKFKSPIAIGMQIQEAELEDGVYKVPEPEKVEEVVHAPSLSLPNAPVVQYSIPKYPFPYFRGKNGGVYLRIPNDDEPDEEKVVYPHDMYVVKRTYDAISGESIIIRLHLPKDGVREFDVDMVSASSKDELRKVLAREGMVAKDYNDLRNYVMQWINELQVAKKADEAHKQFGWVGKNLDAFVVGNQKFTMSGTEFNPPSVHTKSLFPMFEPRGSLLEWQRVISVWNDPKFVIQQYALGMGFGSVLMEIANVSCSAVHFYSKESGVGKSTMLEAMASIWGDPEGMVLSKEDTVAFKMNRCELYHNLPLPLDEITNMDSDAASDMVYQFTGGKQRGRMSSQANTERERGAAWSLMVATTGNTSILEVIGKFKDAPKAEAQRILECHVPRMFDKHEDKTTTDYFTKGVHENYGHAGPQFIKFVLQNKEKVIEIAEQVGQKVDKLGSLTAENRFWSAQITYTITGLLVAKKAGLIDFDVQPILSWAIQTLINSNRINLLNMEGTAIDHMNDFIAEHISNILRIDSTTDSRLNKDAIETYIIPEEVARGKLVARYEPDSKMFYIMVKPLSEWCGKRSIPYRQMKEELVNKYGAEITLVRLTKGYPLSLPPARVIKLKFDLDKADET